MTQRLEFGGFILLRPEVLSRYAAAVVRKVRQHPRELGCIREDELLAGDLDYQAFKRLPRGYEAVVSHTLQETFLSRASCGTGVRRLCAAPAGAHQRLCNLSGGLLFCLSDGCRIPI
jgi:hypothetical protein